MNIKRMNKIMKWWWGNGLACSHHKRGCTITTTITQMNYIRNIQKIYIQNHRELWSHISQNRLLCPIFFKSSVFCSSRLFLIKRSQNWPQFKSHKKKPTTNDIYLFKCDNDLNGVRLLVFKLHSTKRKFSDVF